MNYRHAFHAGNFADVFKHIVLTRILAYLVRKPTPLCYIDTHAGRGAYDLTQAEADRTQEWRGGIAKVLTAPLPAALAPLLAPYRTLVRPGDDGAMPTIYPGSPLIAQNLLRATDRLLLNESQAEEAVALRRAIGSDGRAYVSMLDGYAALTAWVPPKERRGLVLIDPPFEISDEYERLEQALAKSHRKWPTGVYAVWYPIKTIAAADAFAGRLGRGLRLEILLDREARKGRRDRLALIGCGLIVINPPFVLADEARLLLPWLTDKLADDGRGAWTVAEMAGPTDS